MVANHIRQYLLNVKQEDKNNCCRSSQRQQSARSHWSWIKCPLNRVHFLQVCLRKQKDGRLNPFLCCSECVLRTSSFSNTWKLMGNVCIVIPYRLILVPHLADEVKDPVPRRLSWIIQMGPTSSLQSLIGSEKERWWQRQSVRVRGIQSCLPADFKDGRRLWA